MSFLTFLRKMQETSERTLAKKTGLARETVRSCEQNPETAKVEMLDRMAMQLGHRAQILYVPIEAPCSDISTVSASMEVHRDGLESWKIHFMNLTDQFRRCPDQRIILLPPISQLDTKLQALLAAMVQTLCDEVQLDCPEWAKREMFLAQPWFVSGMQSLKATCILESPRPFRRNNIFVLENFMQRA